MKQNSETNYYHNTKALSFSQASCAKYSMWVSDKEAYCIEALRYLVFDLFNDFQIAKAWECILVKCKSGFYSGCRSPGILICQSNGCVTIHEQEETPSGEEGTQSWKGVKQWRGPKNVNAIVSLPLYTLKWLRFFHENSCIWLSNIVKHLAIAHQL